MRSWLVVLALLVPGCARPASPPPAAPVEARAAAPAAAPAAASAETPPPPAEALEDAPGRALTPAELALVRPIFRDSLDYATVRVVDDRYTVFQPDNTYMSPDGFIYAPGALYRDDFAAATVDASLQAVFVHEMVHVWQHQSGQDLLAEGVLTFATNLGSYERAYAYDLDPARDLLDYGMEQQASIVEDYFLVQQSHPPRRLADLSTRASYPAVLHAFITDPRYARDRTADDVARAHLAAAPPPRMSKADPDAAHVCEWRFSPDRRRH